MGTCKYLCLDFKHWYVLEILHYYLRNSWYLNFGFVGIFELSLQNLYACMVYLDIYNYFLTMLNYWRKNKYYLFACLFYYFITIDYILSNLFHSLVGLLLIINFIYFCWFSPMKGDSTILYFCLYEYFGK